VAEARAARVPIVAEVVTVSATAAFRAGEALEAPARWVEVPAGTAAAAHGAAVHGAHQAWEDPAAAAVGAGAEAGGASKCQERDL
jgi:hypothetical protein